MLIHKMVIIKFIYKTRSQLILISYIVNGRFLLYLANDVESNPGPCPCEEMKNSLFIKCAKCECEWHTDTAGLLGITKAALEKLRSWHCPVCITLPDKVKQELIKSLVTENEDQQPNIIFEMRKELENMETRLYNKLNTATYANAATKTQNPSANNQIVDKNLGANINKLVKQINQERKDKNAEQIADKQKRTIIVKQYKGKNIHRSEDVRKPIYDEYPGSVISNARTTAGGSILLEFDDEKTAENIIRKWNHNLYGGNKGAMRGNNTNIPKTTGIVKHVWSQRSQEEIEQELLDNYPIKEVSFFKKNEKYLGIIKITFNTPEDLLDVLTNRIKIFEQRYLVEEFIFQQRVIKCNKCQIFGHVARLCRGEERCGKCGNSHGTKDCTTQSEDYICFHCKGNHQTGDKECPDMKKKLESIKNRIHND